MAKKRHHSSPHHVEHYRRSTHEMYAGPSQTKEMMSRDSSLIHEDMSAPCLLPRHVIDRDWPKARNYGLQGMHMSDLFSEANRQLSSNNESMEEEQGGLHY